MAMIVTASLGVSNNASAATQTFPCGNGQTYTVVDGVVTTTSGSCSGPLVIDSSVTSIASWVFFNMPITSVTIPDSVTDIGIHAFHVSGQLQSVTIGNGVTRLGGNAFSYSGNLTSVSIGNKVQTIEHSTFYNTRITSVFIPKSVKSISTIAFANIPTLRTVTFEDGSAINETGGSINNTTFQDLNGETGARTMYITTVNHCGSPGQRLYDYLVSKNLSPTCTNTPVNTALPVVTGTVQISATLSSTEGSWSNKTSHAIKWQVASNSGGPYTDVATGSTYVVDANVAGKYLRSSVVATNSNGASIAAVSAPTIAVPTPATTTTSTTTTTTSTTTTTVAPTTTTVAPRVVTIEIQAPVTTVATGQASIATIAPTTSVATANTPQVQLNTATTTTAPVQPAGSTTTTSVAMARQKNPALSLAPVIAQVAPGETALTIAGVSSKPNITRENNQLVISSGPVRASISSIEKSGKVTPLDSDGNLRLRTGDLIKLNVGGFKPSSDVDVWLYSTPTNLGSASVGPKGTVVATFAVPKNIDSGAHRLAVVAKLPNGKSATFAVGLYIGDVEQTSTLTRVLIASPIALAIAAGLVLPNQARRRKRRAAIA
jgi:hypothetical protein